MNSEKGKIRTWFKKAFIPHEHNNQHPHFWRTKSVAFLVVLILLVELALYAQSFIVFKKDHYLASVLPGVLISMTNSERIQNSVSSLMTNDTLTQAAQLKANDMATRGYFAHNTPEGYLPWYWLQKAGYSYSHAGENLAVNFTDSADVVRAWMNSPTHRANIVKSVYTETGIAMAEGIYEGHSAIYVVQFFGTPQHSVISKISSSTPSTSIVTSSSTAITSTAKVASSTQATSSAVVSSTTAPSVAGVQSDITMAKMSTATTSVSPIDIAMASPRNLSEYAFIIILSIIVVALLLSFISGVGAHHPKIVSVALVLIVVLVSLIYFNNKNTKESITIPLQSTSSDSY